MITLSRRRTPLSRRRMVIQCAAVMCAALAALATAPSFACVPCAAPGPMTADADPDSLVVCVGQPVRVRVTAKDPDVAPDAVEPYCNLCDAILVYAAVDDGPYQPVTAFGAGVCEEEWQTVTLPEINTPGEHALHLKFDDANVYGWQEDGYIIRNFTLVAARVTAVAGPDELCINEYGQFTATTDPPGYGQYVIWCGGGEPPGEQGATFYTMWTYPGDYTVQAGIDSCDTCNASKTVDVSGGELTDITGPDVVCVGEYGIFSIGTIPSGEEACVTWWSDGDPNNGTGATFQTRWTTPGTKTVSAFCCYGFKTHTVTVKGLADTGVGGPDVLCVGEDATFTASTDPPGGESEITWTGGGIPAEGTGASFTTHWTAPGNNTVTAHYCASSQQKDVKLVGGPISASTTELRYYCDAYVPDTYKSTLTAATQPEGVSYYWDVWGPGEIESGQGTQQAVLAATGESGPGGVWTVLTYSLGRSEL